MKVAMYVRVSTEEQAKEGYSISAQKQRLQNYLKSQGWNLYNVYVDEGYSAKNLDRPSMKKMISDIEKHKFDVVLVYRLDRLVRSVIDLHQLLQLFDKHEVMFKSATEMFDTTSAMGRFFITLVGAMAEWERENLAERVHMGMKRMAEEGKRPGAVAPFGYDYVDGKLIINKQEAKWVKWMFEQYKIKGKRAIASELNKNGILTKLGNHWNDGVVNYLINNPIYCGYIRWNHRKTKRNNSEIMVKGEHDPIIPKELYDEIQATLISRSGKGYKGHVSYPFTGVLKCARCGKPMIGAKRKRKHDYMRFYKCTGRFNYNTCNMPIVNEEVIEEEFLNNEFEMIANETEIEVDNIDYDAIEKDLIKLDKAAKNLKKLFTWGDIEEREYRNEMEEINKKRKEFNNKLKNRSNHVDLEEYKMVMSDVKKNWYSASYDERKLIINTLIESMEIEVLNNPRGGPGSKPIVEIKNIIVK